MVVGTLRLTLQLPGSASLKSKRQVVRKVIDRIRARFNVSIAEVADNDLWQRATLGVAQVGSDAGYVEGALRQVVRFVEELHVAEVGADEIEVLHL